MRWIHARPVVTFVKNVQLCRDRTEVNFPRYPMGPQRVVMPINPIPEIPIAIPKQACSPNPTLSKVWTVGWYRTVFVHLGPEPLAKRIFHRYGSKGIATAGLVIRLNQLGAADDMTSTLGTREEIATSNASPPFSMKQASSFTSWEGCNDRILSGSFPGRAWNTAPSFSSSDLYPCCSKGRVSGKMALKVASCCP